MKVICSHVHKDCIQDHCYHAKLHNLEDNLGQCCDQTKCNGTVHAPVTMKVKCVSVPQKEYIDEAK
jgi:hypothetical protein